MPASVSTLTNSQFLDPPGSTKNVRTEVTFIALLLLQPIAALSHAGFVLMPDRSRHRRRRFSDRYPQSTSRGRVGGRGAFERSPRVVSASVLPAPGPVRYRSQSGYRYSVPRAILSFGGGPHPSLRSAKAAVLDRPVNQVAESWVVA